MHQIRFVDIDRFAVMEQRDEDRQAYGSFRCGDGHDEEDEDESVELMKLPRIEYAAEGMRYILEVSLSSITVGPP